MEGDKDMRDLLEESISVSKENNKILHSMRRSARFSFVGKILFWIIMLGIPAYLYITYLAPIVTSIVPVGASGGNHILNALGLPSVSSIQHTLDTAKNLSHTATQAVQQVTSTP